MRLLFCYLASNFDTLNQSQELESGGVLLNMIVSYPPLQPWQMNSLAGLHRSAFCCLIVYLRSLHANSFLDATLLRLIVLVLFADVVERDVLLTNCADKFSNVDE